MPPIRVGVGPQVFKYGSQDFNFPLKMGSFSLATKIFKFCVCKVGFSPLQR